VEHHPRLVVTGGRGQLGRALGARVPEAVLLDIDEVDLTDREAVVRTITGIHPDVIIHGGAYTAVDAAESDPEGARAVNAGGTEAVAEAAAVLGAAMVYVSTDYVFGGEATLPYPEDHDTAPISVYGVTKLEGERAVREACPAGVILRTSWLYSRFGRNFMTTMLQLAQTRAVVRVVDDQHGAPTAAPDLARAMLDLIERMTQTAAPDRARIYHLAARGETTWHGFAAAIFAGWARRGHRVPTLRPIGTDQYPTAARRPRNSRLDCTRIARDFGLRLPPWQHSLALCLDDLAGAHAEAPR